MEPIDIEAAVLGGLTLGGGGGGLPEMGLEMGLLAHRAGRPRFIDPASLRPQDWVVCVSAVGAPAARDSVPALSDFALALEALERFAGIRIKGVFTNENGALSTLNAYMAGAASGIPVLDLAANGRAHPTTLMGAMGLERLSDYESYQVVVTAEADGEGDRRRSRIAVQGTLATAGNVVREAAARAGGLVIVARNPVTVQYAREAGVEGALAEAVRIGKAILAARSGGADAVRGAVKQAAALQSIATGVVVSQDLTTADGFDFGSAVVAGDGGDRHELSFLNEFITVDAIQSPAGAPPRLQRVATFPDLIAVLDMETGLPVTTAQLREGMRVEVAAGRMPANMLGRGMENPDLFTVLEKILERPIVEYVFGPPPLGKVVS